MRPDIKKLPLTLIYSRLVIGAVIILISIKPVYHFRIYITLLFAIGLFTDIFDGIIARQLKVSTVKLRRLDSTIDQVFFVAVTISTYLLCPEFYSTNALRLILLLSAEGLAYLICFIKFKKEIATHSIGAKIWTLLLFGTLIQIIWQCESGIWFSLCFWVGLITRIEIISIILVLKGWASDIPSLYHAIKLRQGKLIRRHKLFNG
jgi:CDP-diacylglycerol--glycerol-3-phosphate 3-phosphatidyltransferase